MVVRVYVAGPISLGDREQNVRNAIEVASILMDVGVFPFVPHLTHWWDLMLPRPYEDWMSLDFAFLDKCDCLLRLPGESKGADREVTRAYQLGIPVYFGLEEFLKTRGCDHAAGKPAVSGAVDR